MKFQDWMNKTLKEYAKQTLQRKGQFMYNSLCDEDRELASKICCTEYDPFHRDDKIDIFIVYVYLNWKNGEEGENGTLG